MAASSGDLAQNLIRGGLAPQAATLIANAIANVASPQFSQGRNSTDVTPAESLRLIDADTRRYQLTNLDFAPNAPFQERLTTDATRYDGAPKDHPYKDSQPVVSAAPLSNPRVQGGEYITVATAVDGDAEVSKVSLKIRIEPGRHLRLDQSTKSLESVPLATRTEGKFLFADFVESEGKTELVLSLRGLVEVPVQFADGSINNGYVFSTGESAGATSPFCRAYATFNGQRNSTDTAAAVDGDKVLLYSQTNIDSIVRTSTGRFRVTMANPMPTAYYHINGAPHRTVQTLTGCVVIRTSDGVISTPTTTQFQILFLDSANSPVAVSFASVAVFC